MKLEEQQSSRNHTGEERLGGVGSQQAGFAPGYDATKQPLLIRHDARLRMKGVSGRVLDREEGVGVR